MYNHDESSLFWRDPPYQNLSTPGKKANENRLMTRFLANTNIE